MANSSSPWRKKRNRATPGSAGWFREYRIVIVLGWLVALLGVLWVLFVRPGHSPATPLAMRGNTAESPAAPQRPPTKVALPADDAPHTNKTEWWYHSGQLQTESGERYSFHVATFMLQGALAHTAFHGALRDHQTNKHYTNQSRTEGKPGEDLHNGFAFDFDPWQIRGEGPTHTVKMAGKGFAIDLALSDKQPPVLHQAPATPTAGLLDLGPAGWSYYTSRPRMAAQGTLIVDGVAKKVSGEVWFDHQWGDFDASTLRWNWFALQLTDGANLMIYEIFARDGAPLLRFGSYAKDGAVSAIGAGDFKTAARGNWKSKVSGVTYPMEWTLAVPNKGIDLRLDPINRQSQFDARLSTLNVYWEGAVKVSGSHSGIGFQELYGYPAASAPAKN